MFDEFVAPDGLVKNASNISRDRKSLRDSLGRLAHHFCGVGPDVDYQLPKNRDLTDRAHLALVATNSSNIARVGHCHL